MFKPRLESLCDRITPAATPWNSVADHWQQGTLERWVGDSGGVEWYVTIAELGGQFHNVLFAGDGGGARVVVIDPAGDKPVLDRVFFDPDTWRAGVGEIESIGSTLYVTPGVGSMLPGPVYGKIDLATGDTSYHWIDGFDPSFRGGVKVRAVDTDWQIGGSSVDPRKELVFLPGGTAEIVPGPVFFVVDSADDTLRKAVLYGDPEAREEMDFAPASVGVRLSDGSVGMVLQPARVRVIDHYAESSVQVTWDGIRVG